MGALFGALIHPDQTHGPLRARRELTAANSSRQRGVVRLEGLRLEKPWR